ncbi:uncharacterized protein Dsimw501_GD28807 [Drosophila simulans]|uniref:Uncharacterized protein n=1 Tax=Drosophila simulans TaxID=7240 RepID=A0A0J9R5J9_DROSI|nr:uncharacterized protein Dsimw501_GD28807 [Drosophila simulans]
MATMGLAERHFRVGLSVARCGWQPLLPKPQSRNHNLNHSTHPRRLAPPNSGPGKRFELALIRIPDPSLRSGAGIFMCLVEYLAHKLHEIMRK